jgi:hypothetical protein
MKGDNEPLPLKVLHTFLVPKHNDDPNEDRCRVSVDERICAICDGASVSFDSGPWADVLTRRFVENPDVT